MKKLICAKDVEPLVKSGCKECCIEEGTIVTPSAKDLAKAHGIVFTTSTQKSCKSTEAVVANCTNNGGNVDSDMIYNVLKAMMDKGLLKGMFDSMAVESAPYSCDQDAGGLKVVRGNSVRMDYFDTGNPDAKVYFQELVSKDESQMSAGFLTIEKSSFEWNLTYEEIDYVIEGTLEVTINGKTYTAKAGDVLYVPSNSKVIWGSPDKARVFYTTYPANWADLL